MKKSTTDFNFPRPMPHALIIAIDLDDTVADLTGAQCLANDVKLEDLKYDPKTCDAIFEEEIEKKTRQWITGKGVFANLPVIAGAKEAVAEMEKAGHFVFFCTSPLREFHPCAQEKHEWVTKHFGKAHARNMMFVKDKTLVNADILIDDRVHTGHRHQPVWQQIVFDHPRTQDRKDVRHRLKKWSDWQDCIKFINQYRGVLANSPKSALRCFLASAELMGDFFRKGLTAFTRARWAETGERCRFGGGEGLRKGSTSKGEGDHNGIGGGGLFGGESRRCCISAGVRKAIMGCFFF